MPDPGGMISYDRHSINPIMPHELVPLNQRFFNLITSLTAAAIFPAESP